MPIAWKAGLMAVVVLLLSNCTSLNGRCNYLPPNHCGCEGGACNFFWSKNCPRYIVEQGLYRLKACGPCACENDTCSNCWSCGKQFVDP